MEKENKFFRWVVPILLASIFSLLIYIWHDHKTITAQNNADFKVILDRMSGIINTNENAIILHENRIKILEVTTERHEGAIKNNTESLISIKSKL